jgi:hypothetical protein
MDVRMPDGTIITNVPDGISQAELMRRLNLSKTPAKPDMYAAGASAAKSMPWYQKAAANVGAGMADLGLGVRQIYADMFGTEEDSAKLKQEAEQKRALDSALADNSFDMPGGEYVAKGLQVGGNIAPTLVIPAGGAMQSGRFLPWAARAFGTGMGQGALNPVTEGESRGINMVTSGASNVVLPMAMGGVNSVRRMVTQGGAAERAGEQVAGEVTEGLSRRERQAVLQQTLDRLRNAPPTPGGIPLSTAAQLSDAQLARLEAGSRARSGANWYDFDQTQARSVADEVLAATRGADDVAARRGLRSSNRDTLFNQAMASVNEPAFVRDLAGFRASLDTATRSAEASNPAVRGMLTQLADEIDRLGPDFRPEHLATIRANLASKAPLMPTNAYQAAPRESPATMSVLREVDNILNNATGGRWSPVLQSYKRDSDIVRASQAAGKIRESFIDPATGRVRGVAADASGDVPKITEAGLGRALDSARGPRKELVLDPTANARLEAVLDALRRQNIVQGVKRSATAGGGSNTASDLMAAKTASQVAGAIPGGRGLVDRAVNYAGDIKDEALARALQNPDEMIRLIEQQIRRGEPLTPGMELFMRTLSSAPGAAAN